jgi:hypothetical protein
MFRKLVVGGAVAAVMIFSGASAHAEGRVIRLGDLVVYGRPQKPLVTVEVNKISPAMTMTELNQPLADRVETATTRDPF